LESRKALVIALLVLVALWWLHPPRQLSQPLEANVVEITFMGPGGPLAGAMADVIRAFEIQSEQAHAADPTKPVYRVVSGQNAARNQVADPTRFLVSVAGGSPPDVIEFDRYAVAEWAARGGFTPLDPYIARDLKANRPDTPRPDEYFTAAWDEAMYAGKVYGIPKGIDNRALVYNADLLERIGRVDAQGNALPPRTWDELREVMRKLTVIERRRDGRQMTLEQLWAELPSAPDASRVLDTTQYRLLTVGFIPMYGDSWLYMYGWMNGGEFMSADGTRVTLNDPKIVEALEFMKSLYDELGGFEQVQVFQTTFAQSALDPFITGKVAMKIGGFWDLARYGQFARSIRFGIAPPPVPTDRFNAGLDKISWTGGFAYSIPSTARNKDAAWELIRYLMSDKAIAMLAEAERQFAEAEGRLFVPNQSPKKAINAWLFEQYLRDNVAMPDRFTAAMKVYNDLLPYARFRPSTPVGQMLWNYHVSSTEAALYGNKTAPQALDEATARVQASLDRTLNPPEGLAIRSWAWFVPVYAALVLIVGAIVFAWDTSAGPRRVLMRLVGIAPTLQRVEPPAGPFTRGQWFGGFVCVAPWLVGFLVFAGGPMLFSLIISFCWWDILNVPRFTGMDNYRQMLFQDELVWKSLGNTLFMMLAVPLGMALSLGIALLLNQGAKGLAAWRTLFYLPTIVPFVATSLLFIFILNPEIGLLNRLLQPVLDVISGGQWQAPMWLQNEHWAKPGIILMGLWGAGGGMILWLAGLKGIPQSLYEAASVDGATTFQQFVHVTIPQLTPYIFFNLVIGFIGTLQIFDQAFIMTSGGPANATLFYVYHLFNNAFRYGMMGYASALAWLLFFLALILTVIQIRLSRRWVHYED
jgi:ABC-type sugar transport system permease subunit/ABC-type glycerol-3-phosphate transport system substrate-binding protein